MKRKSNRPHVHHKMQTVSFFNNLQFIKEVMSQAQFDELPDGIKKSYIILEHKEEEIRKRLIRISKLGQKIENIRNQTKNLTDIHSIDQT